MKYRVALATGTVLALVLSACGEEENTVDASGSQTGGEINIAVSAQPPTLDPMMATAHVTRTVARVFYEPLLTFDAEGEVQPVLAEDYEVSDDGLTLTFTLREGVPFHDGTVMEAPDVVASLERWRELSGVGQNYFSEAEIESPGEGVVEVHLPEPMYVAPLLLADPSQEPAIMPAEVIEGAGDSGVEEFIGTGPYLFENWVADQHIELSKFEEYSSPESPTSGMAGAKEAYFDTMNFHFVTDASTRVNGLQTGEYDLATHIPWDNADAVNNADGTDITLGESGLSFAIFNKQEGVMSDIHMRRAVVAAMDTEAALHAGYSGPDYFTDDPALMPPDSPWYIEPSSETAAFHQQQDLDLAAEYMEEAGYNGEEIRILTTRDYEDHYNQAVMLQQQMTDAGMNAELIVQDWATVVEVGDQDPSAWDINVNAIANWPMVPATFLFLQPTWRGWTDDPGIAQASDAMITAPDEQGAVGAMEDLQETYFDYLPIAKFGNRTLPFGVSTKLDGFEFVTGVGEIYHHLRPAE